MTEHFVGRVGEGKRLAIIAICNLTSVQNKPYATHLQFAFRLARDNPDFQFLLYTPYRMSIANFRNSAATAALNAEAEYLMFLDDDAVLIDTSSLFKDLLNKIDKHENRHIVMPVVYVRGYPFEPMFFKWVTNEEELIEGKGLTFYSDFKEDLKNGKANEDKLLEVAAIGCHTCLIKTEVFKAIEAPYFLTGLYNTEDVYFCMKLRDYIENIGIFVATDICSSHLLDPLYVNDQNVDLLRKLYKELGMDVEKIIEDFLDQPEAIKTELDEMGEVFEK